MLISCGFLLVQGIDLNDLTFPFVLVPPASDILFLHSMLPNTTQGFDNFQPAWVMLELRVGLQTVPSLVVHLARLRDGMSWGGTWASCRRGPMATS